MRDAIIITDVELHVNHTLGRKLDVILIPITMCGELYDPLSDLNINIDNSDWMIQDFLHHKAKQYRTSCIFQYRNYTDTQLWFATTSEWGRFNTFQLQQLYQLLLSPKLNHADTNVLLVSHWEWIAYIDTKVIKALDAFCGTLFMLDDPLR